jgi:hypothetical protein
MGRKTVPLSILSALLLLATFVWSCRNGQGSIEQTPTATAARRALKVMVSTNGVIEPVDRSEIFAPIDGLVAQLPIHEGDEVAASRFAFFTANQIELIPSASLDLFINMNSLMEMKMEQIQNFLTHISRLTTRSFLSRQYLRWRNHLDDLTVGKDDFVMADGWRKTLDCVDDIHPEFFNQIWERKQAASPQPG